MMIIRFAEVNEHPQILKHYQICNYGGGILDADLAVIAIDEQIIGAVRICMENGVKVLRGMQVKPAWQQKGIGSSMLRFLTGKVDLQNCYCLPYRHLKEFYARIGFQEIQPKNAPPFLAERFEKYLSSGGNREMMIMRVNKKV